MSEKELEEIRSKKLSELKKKSSAKEKKAQMQQKMEQKKQALLRRILTTDARQRLSNLEMVKPDFTSRIELQLIQLAQRGKIPVPLNDKQLRRILLQLQGRKREINIRRR